MDPQPTSLVEVVAREGYAIIDGVVIEEEVCSLIDAIDRVAAPDGVRQRSGQTYAIRNLLQLVPEVRDLAAAPAIRSLVETVVGAEARVVRGQLLDKTLEANWKIRWHQDAAIAVGERREAPGFRSWSVKAGVLHVRPPAAVLGEMLAVRLHLDDCGEANGPLMVLPGSHREGGLTAAEIQAWRERVAPVACCVRRGGVLLMRPLLLHASSSAQEPGHRRVIHLEFAACSLPCGLEWHEARAG
jgi:ectoine hydroxylase-related dioxygenase (phytanoyl-CoA dioxygenase family)